jgi:hypothetical protein
MYYRNIKGIYNYMPWYIMFTFITHINHNDLMRI